MVRFHVTKGSAFVFECSSSSSNVAAAPLSDKLRALATRVKDIEALDIHAVNIVKRLDLADVDRMVALSEQHPPQCVVGPASTAHVKAFEAFTAYLKQRQRAGVATLAGDFLLLLTPIPHCDRALRCLVIKSNDSSDALTSAAANSALGDMADNDQWSRTHDDATAASRPQKRRKSEQSFTPAAAAAGAGAELRVDGSVNDDDVATLPSPRFRDVRYAELRHAVGAFNAHHCEVLHAWSAR